MYSRIKILPFVAALALGAVVCLGAVPPERKQQAAGAYERAGTMRAALENQPEGKRRKEDFKKVIDAYTQVARLSPSYSKTPLALKDVAELYRQMGKEYSSDTYFREAINSYRALSDQYPNNRIARDSLYIIAEIYKDDLDDREAARKAFQFYITMYPKTEKADEARAYLAGGEPPATPKTPSREAATVVPPPEPARIIPPAALVKEAELKAPGSLRMVNAVRKWVGPSYLRIVVETDGEIKFDSARLSNPDRIVIDLQGARLSHELGARSFPVESGYLHQIRVAQFSSDVARVVLDAEKIDSYSVFSLPNPFRLVIDVHGGNPKLLAKATPASPVAVPDPRKPQKTASPLPAIPSPAVPIETATVKPAPMPAPVTDQDKTAKIVPTPDAPKVETPRLETPKVEVATSLPPAEPTKPKKHSKTKPEPDAVAVAPTFQPAVPTEDGSRTLTRALGLKIGRIVIDPGHGGHDTGTLGPTGLEEKEVVLDVGLKLKKLLEENTNCEVVMTRSDDTFIPLEERTAIANEKGADLFISVHANASQDRSARGIETYYLNFTSSPDALEVAARENASSQEVVHQLQDLIKKIAMTEKIEESQDFATQVQREVFTHVTKASGTQRDRGIKKAPFVVLIGANMPSVLAEISFLTNPKDEKLLRKSDYREKIAEALCDGILDYLKTLGDVKAVQRVAADHPPVARPN